MSLGDLRENQADGDEEGHQAHHKFVSVDVMCPGNLVRGIIANLPPMAGHDA